MNESKHDDDIQLDKKLMQIILQSIRSANPIPVCVS